MKLSTQVLDIYCAGDRLEFDQFGDVALHIEAWQRDEHVAEIALATDGVRQLRDVLNDFLGEAEAPEVKATEAKTTPPLYANLSPLCQTVYQHMNRAGSISARDAFDDHGITSASLARRICDIEAEGFKIKRERRVHPVTEQRYTRYSLVA